MTIRRTLTNTALLLAGASILPLSAAAYAQESEQSAAPARGDVITVTARRREESLVDVPMAVTAFSGEQLENLGAQDITFVGQVTPNVTLETSRATNTTLTAFIRGVGQQDRSPALSRASGSISTMSISIVPKRRCWTFTTSSESKFSAVLRGRSTDETPSVARSSM